MYDGTITIGTKVDTSGVDKGIDEIETKVKGADFVDGFENKTKGIGSSIKGIGSKLLGVFKGIGGALKGILLGALKLVGTFLVILPFLIAIVGAIYIIKKAIEKVKAEHNEIGQKIEYIKYLINEALAPAIESVANFIAKVINWVLDAVIKLIAYIGYIVKFLTGYNMFKNAGMDKFKEQWEKSQEESAKTQKNTGGIAKNLKEARKQLAGFDEMNVLNDNKSGGTGGINLGGAGGLGDLKVDFKLSDIFDIGNIKIPQWLEDMMDFLTNPKKYTSNLTGFFKGTQWEKMGKGIAQIINGIINGFVGIQETLVGVGELLIGIFMLDPNVIWDGIKKIFDGIFMIVGGAITTIQGLVNTIVGAIYGILKPIVSWVTNNIINPINKLLKTINPINIGMKIGGMAITLAKNLWNSVLKPLIEPIAKGFNDILKTINPISLGWKIGGKLYELTTNLWNIVKQPITDLVNGINNKLKNINPINLGINAGKGITSFFGGLFGAKGMVIKYAKGGIINRPSKGVPLPIGGEHGMEGVVPLTDSQQMALLGEAIGKYITINANITNSMNGRVLSRELQKIQNEQSFASNRW